MTRRLAHAALVIAASPAWMIGCLAFWIALRLVLLADRAWAGADRGNCWSFAGPLWHRHGGYLLIRPADGLRIPHAIWVPSWPGDTPVLQTRPVRRVVGRWWQVWQTLYFRFSIVRFERPHDSSWADLDVKGPE